MTARDKGHPGIWLKEIVDHLEDFPRQYAALENAMAAFGGSFKVADFKRAYESRTDMDAYNRAQAVERATSRVQNYVADLAVAGVKLVGLQPTEGNDGGAAERAFTSLVNAGVVDASLGRRLKRAQKARSRIEHSYAQVPAGDVHAAAKLVHESARSFIGPYRTWIGQHLE